jgi:hypothetical protein
MDENELKELLKYAEDEEGEIEAIHDANVTGDQQLTSERIARALEASCNTDKALVRAIASMNQRTRHLCEDIKEERTLISATHDKLQDVLNLDGSMQSKLTSTVNHYNYQLDKVVDKQDDKLQEVTQRAVHHINKSVAVGGFLIVGFSILSAILATIGLFFTIYCGDFFKDLWLNNPIATVAIVIVECALLFACFCGFQKSVKSWWDSHLKDKK